MKFDCNQSWLLSLPLYHVSGKVLFGVGYIVVRNYISQKRRFYVSLLETTHVSLVPTQLQRLLDYLRKIRQFIFYTPYFTWWYTYSC